MNNSIQKNCIKQKKLNRHQQIGNAQKEWIIQVNQALLEKEKLGYKEFSWDAFRKVDVYTLLDSSLKSEIIDLQEQYRDLLEQRDLLWLEDNIVAEFNKKHAVVSIKLIFLPRKKAHLEDKIFL